MAARRLIRPRPQSRPALENDLQQPTEFRVRRQLQLPQRRRRDLDRRLVAGWRDELPAGMCQLHFQVAHIMLKFSNPVLSVVGHRPAFLQMFRAIPHRRRRALRRERVGRSRPRLAFSFCGNAGRSLFPRARGPASMIAAASPVTGSASSPRAFRPAAII
jgi:hypothetical protein